MSEEKFGQESQQLRREYDQERFEAIQRGDYSGIPAFELIGMLMGYQSILDRGAGKSLGEFDPGIAKLIAAKEQQIIAFLETVNPDKLVDSGKRLETFCQKGIQQIREEMERRSQGQSNQEWF